MLMGVVGFSAGETPSAFISCCELFLGECAIHGKGIGLGLGHSEHNSKFNIYIYKASGSLSWGSTLSLHSPFFGFNKRDWSAAPTLLGR